MKRKLHIQSGSQLKQSNNFLKVRNLTGYLIKPVLFMQMFNWFHKFHCLFFIGSRNLDSTYSLGYGYYVTFPFESTLNPCYESFTMSCIVSCIDCDLCVDTSTGGCFTCPTGTYTIKLLVQVEKPLTVITLFSRTFIKIEAHAR
jgi:hypothetical protein